LYVKNTQPYRGDAKRRDTMNSENGGF